MLAFDDTVSVHRYCIDALKAGLEAELLEGMDATGLRVWLKIIGQVRNWLLTWTSEG
jgi:hypothetical protein